MSRSKGAWILTIAAALACAPAFAQRVDFVPLDVGFTPVDMSLDGSKMLAFGPGGEFTWTEDEGFVLIGDGGCSGQLSMSFDGSTIVSNQRNADNKCEAARYDGDGNWTLMGSEPGGLPCGATLSSAYATNNDTAVGLFWTASLCRAIGGTWDLATATAGPELTSTVPNRPTRGNGITDDGTIVVGWQDAVTGFRQAARWVNGVQELITDDDGNRVGEVIATNSDATALVGTGWQADGGGGRGWLWREGMGMIPMGVGALGANRQSVPLAVSEDGNTVVGLARDFLTFTQRGWIWTDKKGFAWLDDFVKGRQSAGWMILGGNAISGDGKRIAGYGFNPDFQLQAFLIEIGRTGK